MVSIGSILVYATGIVQSNDSQNGNLADVDSVLYSAFFPKKDLELLFLSNQYFRLRL